MKTDLLEIEKNNFFRYNAIKGALNFYVYRWQALELYQKHKKQDPPNEVELVRFLRNKIIKAASRHIDLKRQRFRMPNGSYILFTKERIRVIFYEDLEEEFRET